MITDLDEGDLDERPEYDLCIVGSGPAGATLAHELRGRGLRIAVLESGKRSATPLGNSLRLVESEGIRITERSRERALGGASTTWAGVSAVLDPIDVAPRPWPGRSGWPIAHAELLRWYARAAARYRFPAPEDFDVGASQGPGVPRASGTLRVEWERLQEKVFLAADPPQDFGAEWTDTYRDPRIDVWLDATLVELKGVGDARRVAHGVVRSGAGRTQRIRARVFVLATGGIENPRILLSSRDPWPAGLGNESDQVGRCMMNHPKGYWGLVRFARPLRAIPYSFGPMHGGFVGYAGLRLREEEQVRLEVLNSYVRLEPLLPWWETDHDVALDGARVSPPGLAGVALRGVRLGYRVVHYLYFRLLRARPRIEAARVRNFMEMEADPENRVMLSEERDAYGQLRPLVRHRPTARDRRSLVELHNALDEELRRTGVGRLEGRLQHHDPWPIDQDASHHMGTTRMGADPALSVVNSDLRLHRVDNVYVAGASTFPTGGCANPTYTIVALSIRLADHLARDVFGLEGEV